MLGVLQRLVARGFAPIEEARRGEQRCVYALSGRQTIVGDPSSFFAEQPTARRTLTVLCPTYVARCDATMHQEIIAHLREEIVVAARRHTHLNFVFIVGMQWQDDEREALRRLEEAARTWDPDCPAKFLGFTLPGQGKIRTINEAIHVAAPLHPFAWIWLDDDVTLAPHCLDHLVVRFLENRAQGAVGARCMGVSSDQFASRLLRRIQSHTAPPRQYPSACCMIVASDVVAGGIPARRIADDGHVLFQLLDANRADPYQLLHIHPDARCYYVLASSFVDTLRRLRRTMYSHVTCLADWPPETARFYFSHVLFYGLWPLGRWNGGQPVWRGAIRWSIKFVFLMWFLTVAAHLGLRGMLRRPLQRVEWGGVRDYRRPCQRGQSDE